MSCCTMSRMWRYIGDDMRNVAEPVRTSLLPCFEVHSCPARSSWLYFPQCINVVHAFPQQQVEELRFHLIERKD